MKLRISGSSMEQIKIIKLIDKETQNHFYLYTDLVIFLKSIPNRLVYFKDYTTQHDMYRCRV